MYVKVHDPWATGAGGGTALTAAALDQIEQGIADAGPPIGTVYMWMTDTAPSDHVLLRGQAISRTTYAVLFALWGTAYGVGDGSTTFNVPNFQTRIPIGKATSGTAGTLGATFGELDHVHTGPSHRHNVGAHTHPQQAHQHLINFNSGVAGGSAWVSQAAADFLAAADGHIHPVTGYTANDGVTTTGLSSAFFSGYDGTGDTGGGNPPSLVVNFIVRAL